MRWVNRRQSGNVEDVRGGRGGVAVGGGVTTLLVALAVYLMGGDPRAVIEQAGREPSGAGSPASRQVNPAGGQNDELKSFVGVVLADTEDVWHDIFQKRGRRYQEPKLVLFSGQVRSACGVAGASSGPFYCPADQKLYIDLSFYRELKERHQAPGDFAQAYVIAHEIGHHIQTLTGVAQKVQSLQSRMSEADANRLLVRLELQADFYAGVWAHYAQKKGLLEAGDVEEAMRAASAIGDDRLQLESKGYVVPDSFTHGTSEQRLRWFQRGLESGDISQGDTFSARSL